METLLVHTENSKQLKTNKAVLKALNVSFETTKESPYSRAFVEKIEKSRKQFEAGKSRKVSLEEIWK